MQQSERKRKNWAMGLSITLTLIIFVGFGFYRGFLSLGGSSSSQIANVVVAVEKAPTPLQSTKETFQSVFQEIGEKYVEFKNALSNVFVPFITSIEVYDRE